MTTPGVVVIRRSHAWQNSFVWASSIVGVLHIIGGLVPRWDPSLALSELPTWESFVVGGMMLSGGILAAMSRAKRCNQLEMWQLEHAALRLLFITWVAQTAAGVYADWHRAILWVVYGSIAYGFYVRLGQSKHDRKEALSQMKEESQ